MYKKKRAFRTRDCTEVCAKGIKSEAKGKIRQLQKEVGDETSASGNTRDVWTGMRQITSFNMDHQQSEGSLDRAN